MIIKHYVETKSQNIYIHCFKQGITKAMAQSYDQYITDLEKGYLSGSEENLQDLIWAIQPFDTMLTVIVELMKTIDDSFKTGPAIIDHIYEIFEIHSPSDPHIHKVSILNLMYCLSTTAVYGYLTYSGHFMDFKSCRIGSTDQFWKMDFIFKK